jgi:leucyl-tRNA synthetase
MGGTKMSKSKGNVSGPNELVAEWGADPVRLYILFMGPADQDMEWTQDGIEGMARFVRRLWRVVNEVAAGGPTDGDGPLVRKAHQTIQRVSDDLDRRMQFHTPISAVMELVNDLGDDTAAPGARFAAETAVSLLQPWAPHIAEELWERLGHSKLWEVQWPEADPAALERDTFELVVQVNGKVRDRIEVPAGLSDDELAERALASDKVQAQLNGKEIRKTIVVPGKLVNLVV